MVLGFACVIRVTVRGAVLRVLAWPVALILSIAWAVYWTFN